MRDEAGPKERIVKTAVSLFYRQGVNATGINQIIDEASVAKASFYYHFKSKDDLVAETVYSFGNMVKERFRRVVHNSTTPMEFITAFVKILKRDIQSDEYFGCPIANIAFDTDAGSVKIHTILSGVMDEILVLLTDFIHEMRVKGHLTSQADEAIIAKRMLQVYEGALTMWKMTGDAAYADDLEYMMKRIIFV
ncbi:MAG TPA: TetR/AcrR family transcriptional regulator [Spirochaetota bacterium]|nr:TetR/AcrR family transcriptional regulator [Spirochaetota bacterium]